MPHLERLRADHADAVLDFEIRNREYFAASIPDRGDGYFTDFGDRHTALLAEQDTGTIHMHVVFDDGVIAGRVNLVDVDDGHAELGYRIARSVTGRGLATWAVAQVCDLAAGDYGLTTLHARTTRDNPASQRVLMRNGFTLTGDVELSGRPGHRYTRVAAAPDHGSTST